MRVSISTTIIKNASLHFWSKFPDSSLIPFLYQCLQSLSVRMSSLSSKVKSAWRGGLRWWSSPPHPTPNTSKTHLYVEQFSWKTGNQQNSYVTNAARKISSWPGRVGAVGGGSGINSGLGPGPLRGDLRSLGQTLTWGSSGLSHNWVSLSHMRK